MKAVAEMTPDEIQDEIASLQQLKLKRFLTSDDSLHSFIEAVWPIVEPTIPFVSNWHIKALCQILQEVEKGEHQRVLINVPPGTMKSLLVSVFFPCWLWTRNQGLRFLVASYSAHLTGEQNRKAREIITSDWYHRLFGVNLAEDLKGKGNFGTSAGGFRMATSIGGAGTGKHPDYIIIDDPTSAQEALSQVEREKANTWFDRTISSRGVSRNAKVIVIMQRLHEDDLSGHLLRKGNFFHICWPMRYEGASDEYDPRTRVGELLWPSVFTEDKVRQLELDLGPYGAAGQLQQRPAPEGGGLFKKEWFRIVDAVPARPGRRARGWDTAATEGGGDYTVGVKIFTPGDGTFYIEDVVRGQWAPGGVEQQMVTAAHRDGGYCSQREEREVGASGKAVIAARVKTLVGFDYAGVPVTGDKVTRAKPFRAQCEAGNVLLVRGSWNETYLNELAIFPNGRNDDQVDGSSCAFNALVQASTNVLDFLRQEAREAGIIPCEPCACGCGRKSSARSGLFCCDECRESHFDTGVARHTEECDARFVKEQAA